MLFWELSKCHRTLYFHNTHTSLPINRADGHKNERPKVEDRVCLALEVEEEEKNAMLESEEEARLVEETRLKSDEEGQARMRDDEEARLAEE